MVLMSGFTDVDTDEIFNMGAYAFIKKPFGFQSLKEVLDSIAIN